MKIYVGIGILLLLIVSIGNASAGQGTADTFYVDVNGGEAYTKIQDAVDDCHNGDGDTILVDSGTYYETIKIDNKDGITMKPQDTNDEVIITHDGQTPTGDGGGDGFLLLQSDDITIHDIVIYKTTYNGINILSSDDADIRRLDIQESGTSGINIKTSADYYIKKCRIKYNGYAGIRIYDWSSGYLDSPGEIYNCQINRNTWDGISIDNRRGTTNKLKIEYCRMAYNGDSGTNGRGMDIYNSNGIVVRWCVFVANLNYGVYLDDIPQSGEDQGTNPVKFKFSNFKLNNGGSSNDQVCDDMAISGYDGALWDYNWFADHDNTDSNSDGYADSYYYIPTSDDYHAWNSYANEQTITIGDVGPWS